MKFASLEYAPNQVRYFIVFSTLHGAEFVIMVDLGIAANVFDVEVVDGSGGTGIVSKCHASSWISGENPKLIDWSVPSV